MAVRRHGLCRRRGRGAACLDTLCWRRIHWNNTIVEIESRVYGVDRRLFSSVGVVILHCSGFVLRRHESRARECIFGFAVPAHGSECGEECVAQGLNDLLRGFVKLKWRWFVVIFGFRHL